MTSLSGSLEAGLLSYLGLTGLVLQESQSPTGGGATTNKDYLYDVYGHRIGMSKTVGQGTPEHLTYGYDPHGSVSTLLNDSGGVKATYGYGPYGEKDDDLSEADTSEVNPLNPYRYSGRRFDPGSKSYDMGARRFGPDTSRFLQRDLFLGALDDLSLGLDPLTANRYALAGGNPVGYAEWDGHVPLSDGGGGSYTSPSPPSGGRGGTAAGSLGGGGGGGSGGGAGPEGQSTVLTRVAGGLKLIGGGLEAAVGCSATGAGAVFAVVVCAHGGDVAASGFRQLVSGEEDRTLLSRGLEAAGLSEGTAEDIDDAFSIVGTAGAASSLARAAGTPLRESARAVPNAPRVGGSITGRSYGKLGTVVENPNLKIAGFQGARDPAHALNQIVNRGVSPSTLRNTVEEPVAVLRQSGGNYLFLSRRGGVVVRPDGQVVTAYTSRQFQPHVMRVLRDAGAG